MSWLSGVAMAATEAQCGKIVFPSPPRCDGGETSYLDWIAPPSGKDDALNARRKEILPERGAGPVQGAIPNRFKASVPSGFDGHIVEKAVRDAWIALAEQIWREDIAPRLDGERKNLCRKLWDQQHQGFWEIAWVLTANPGASNLLDRRKNWRSHLPLPEPGMKCHLMEG